MYIRFRKNDENSIPGYFMFVNRYMLAFFPKKHWMSPSFHGYRNNNYCRVCLGFFAIHLVRS